MTGAVAKKKYHYYKCVNSKGSMKTCHKEKVDREFIEELVIKKGSEGLLDNEIDVIYPCSVNKTTFKLKR